MASVRSLPALTSFAIAWRVTPRRRAASACEIHSSGSTSS